MKDHSDTLSGGFDFLKDEAKAHRDQFDSLERSIERESDNIQQHQTSTRGLITAEIRAVSNGIKGHQEEIVEEMRVTRRNMSTFASTQCKIAEDLANLSLSSENVMSTQFQTNRDISQFNQKLENIDTSVHKLHSTISASDPDGLARLFRLQLRSELKPLMEHLLKSEKSTIRNEATLQQLYDSIDCMSEDLADHASTEKAFATTQPKDQRLFDIQSLEPAHSLAASIPTPSSNELSHSQTLMNYLSSPRRHRRAIFRRKWTHNWFLGRFDITLEKTREIHTSIQCYFAISIAFYPKETFCFIPAVSMQFDTGPNQSGYYQIAPLITFFPIIPLNHPIWHHVTVGNIVEVKEVFSNGLVSPRCQDENGISLLHVSYEYIFKADNIYVNILYYFSNQIPRPEVGDLSNKTIVCCMVWRSRNDSISDIYPRRRISTKHVSSFVL